MKKVIIDTRLFACQSKNPWISFLPGQQVQFVRRVLTDLGQYHQARIIKLADFKQKRMDGS